MPLFTAPDRGPRCAHGQQQQFEQCQSPVGHSTCKCSSIYNMTTCLQIVYVNKKEKKTQLIYQTKSAQTADRTKTALHSQHFICTSTKSHPSSGRDPIFHQVASTRHSVALSNHTSYIQVHISVEQFTSTSEILKVTHKNINNVTIA